MKRIHDHSSGAHKKGIGEDDTFPKSYSNKSNDSDSDFAISNESNSSNKFVEIINAFHDGDDVNGSGRTYTLQEAKDACNSMKKCQGFTFDKFNSDGGVKETIAWFHSRITFNDLTAERSNHPHAEQILYVKQHVYVRLMQNQRPNRITRANEATLRNNRFKRKKYSNETKEESLK